MRLLVGPYHDPEHWVYMRGAFDGHDTLTFGTGDGVDLPTRPLEPLSAILDRLPPGWQPDLLLLWRPEYGAVPIGLEDAPFPVVMLTSDWYLEFHDCVETARFVNAVVTGSRGERAFRAAGFDHVVQLPMLGYEPGVDGAHAAPRRDIDVLYAGSVNWAAHARREHVLAALLDLPAKYNLVFRTGLCRTEYNQQMARARIVINLTVVGEINMRVYETCAAGACLFLEEDNLDVPALLPDGEAAVYYNEQNLLDKVLWHLEHEEQRADIAARGHELMRGVTYRANMEAVVRHLQQLGRDRLMKMGREIRRACPGDRVRHFVSANLRYNGGGGTVLRDLMQPLQSDPTPRDRLLSGLLDYSLAVDEWRGRDLRPTDSAHLTRAVKAVLMAARDAPHDIPIAFALAAFSQHHGAPQVALQLLQRLIGLLNSDRPVPYAGTAFYVMEPNEDLRRRFERAAWEAVERGLDPGNALRPLLLDRAWRWLGELMVKAQRLPDAAEAFAYAQSAYPEGSLSAVPQASLLATLGRWEDAVQVLRAHAGRRPLDTGAHLKLAEALLRMEAYGEALDVLLRVARIFSVFGDAAGAHQVGEMHRRIQARTCAGARA